jgi:hypothetical protein
MAKNEQALREWSQLHPKMLNMFGDLKSIERHFTDFDKLILLLKEDVGAKSGISHTILFNEMQSGMDEKSYDITLKQTETVRRSSNAARDQLQPIVRMLVFGRYGYDSPQAKKADKLHIKFDAPVEPTTQERNETATAGVNMLNGFIQAGLNLIDSFTLVKQSLPSFELPDDIRKRLEIMDDTETEVDEAATKSGLFDGWPGFGRKRK